MHIIEIRRDIADVAEPMGRVRNWLDEHRIAPQLFHPHQTVFRPGVCGGRWGNNFRECVWRSFDCGIRRQAT